MNMKIGSDTEFVNITLLERAPAGTPTEGDVRIAVQVRLKDFGGTYDTIWLERPSLEEFIGALRRLDAERQGISTLTSSSPDEFILTIRSLNRLGQLAAEVTLARYQYSGPTYWRTAVSGGFELDPSTLPSLVSDIESLLGNLDG